MFNLFNTLDPIPEIFAILGNLTNLCYAVIRMLKTLFDHLGKICIDLLFVRAIPENNSKRYIWTKCLIIFCRSYNKIVKIVRLFPIGLFRFITSPPLIPYLLHHHWKILRKISESLYIEKDIRSIINNPLNSSSATLNYIYTYTSHAN